MAEGDTVTPRELAKEALSRASEATKGPWEDAQGSVWENGGPKVIEEFVRCPGDNVAVAADILDPETSLPSPANSKFIAHAREDVPALALAVIALSDRVEELESTLKGFLPRCNHCGVFATRGYIHCSGQHMKACDNDKCMEENFCDECGQVWYGDDPRCGGFNGGVPCTGTSKHPETHVSHIHDLRHAVVVRSLQ